MEENTENDPKGNSLTAKRNRLMKEANWEDLLIGDKMRLFDKWSLISMLANLA